MIIDHTLTTRPIPLPEKTTPVGEYLKIRDRRGRARPVVPGRHNSDEQREDQKRYPHGRRQRAGIKSGKQAERRQEDQCAA